MTISSELLPTIAPAAVAAGRGTAVASGDIQAGHNGQDAPARKLFGSLLARQSSDQTAASQKADAQGKKKAHGKKDTIPVDISVGLSGNVRTGSPQKAADGPDDKGGGKDGKSLTGNALPGNTLPGRMVFAGVAPLKNPPSEQKTVGTENNPRTPTVKNTGDKSSVGRILLATDTEAPAKTPGSQIPDGAVAATVSPALSNAKQDGSLPLEAHSDKNGHKDNKKATLRHGKGPVTVKEAAPAITPQKEAESAPVTVTRQAPALNEAAKTDPAAQLAATVLLPAEQNRPEKSRNSKNSATNAAKITPEKTPDFTPEKTPEKTLVKTLEKAAETSTENGPATDRKNPGLKDAGKKNTALSVKAKAASHTPDVRRNFIDGLQDKPSVTSHQPLETASTSLSANAGQTPAVTEGKTAGPGPAQLQNGLLSLQDVSQNNGHNIKNLTPASLSTVNQAQINQNINPNHVTPQMVAKQIGLAIARQTGDGKHSFKISLKPADLGHVDIRMDIQTDGRVSATITADNQRTLNLLHRDQGSLQRALTNSGFDVGGNNLNFTLKQQQQNPAESGYGANITGDTEDDGMMPPMIHDIISQQQMRMTYSDNILDINI